MSIRLSTKEAGRTLLLLPLLLGVAGQAHAQSSARSARLPQTFIASNLPAPTSQTVPSRNQSMIFTGAVPRLLVDQSFQFSVAAVNPDGSQVRLTRVSWRSSNTETATISETGMVRALRVGRTFVSATSGRQEVRVRVSVLAPTPSSGNLVTSIELTPNAADVESGTTLQFAASARTADGALVPEAPVTYVANDTSIARISTAGLLSAKAPGHVEVTATSGGAVNKVSVTVGRARVSAITVTPAPVAVTTADTMVLKVSATRRDGSVVATADLKAAAQRGSFRGWTYVPPTDAGADTITVTASDGFAVRVPATVSAVAAPTPSEPVPVTPPVEGSLPLFATPARPAATVNVAYPAVTGRTIRVAAGDVAGLQAALNTAVGGDEIVLPNGSDFVGNFELPKHSGAGVVVIRSETVGVPSGTRMTPSAATGLAKIGTTTVTGAFTTRAAASGWRLVGLNISVRSGAPDNYGIVVLGSGTESLAADLVSNIVLDRVFITGASNNTSRCVALNGNHLAVIDSWLADCHAKGRDAQAVAGWTGQGPFLIQNNYLEGSGENILFGGADPRISGLVPSDITILNNHVFKPLSWYGKWSVKNSFELKNAKRVLFEGNVIENNWTDGQVGFAVLLQPTNQDGYAPWSTVQDVTMINNIIRNSTSGINMYSRLQVNGAVSEPMQRVLIRNNLFLEIGRDPFSGLDGRFVQMLDDLRDVTLVQNAFLGAVARNAVMFDGIPQTRTTLANNLFGNSTYGIFGGGVSEGIVTLSTFAPNGYFRGNAVTGRPATSYPMGNMFPAAVSSTDFVSPSSGDYTVKSTVSWSAYGSSIVGVNGQAILDATRRTVTP